jgi:MGT family glycosyltransferase
VARIAVVNIPFYSHAEAATRLSGVLVRQGHEVIVWAPERCRGQIEACGARFALHDPAMPPEQGGPGQAMVVVAGVASVTEPLVKELIEQLHAQQVDLVVHDSRVLWAMIAGDYLGIPRIVSHPMFPVISPHSVPGSRLGEPSSPSLDPDQARQQFAASWASIARRWGVEIEHVFNVIHSTAETTFTYTTEEIVGDYQLLPGWHCIGPLMTPPRRTDSIGGRPLVYVCFGTAFNFRSELFRTVIAALADQPFDVLISTGRGPVASAALEPLPANVEVREFVSSREILARASVHVTHGGCNSVHEALLAGVPMVCIPQAFDQFPLTGRVELLGAGLVVNEDVAAIRDGVRLLVGSAKAHSRARELSEHLAHYDGEGRVAAAVDGVLSENAALTR